LVITDVVITVLGTVVDEELCERAGPLSGALLSSSQDARTPIPSNEAAAIAADRRRTVLLLTAKAIPLVQVYPRCGTRRLGD
jgi:hypothetical protein